MKPFVHDQYAPLNHKSTLTDGVRRPGVATWVPQDDARRLAAYRILAAYRDNVARNYLPDSFTDDARDKYREYGHAALLVAAGRAALLGDEQTIDVPAATAEDGDETANADRARAQAALTWLQQWAIRERLTLRLLEGEEDAVGLGDAIYTLGWDSLRGRPRLRVYDPGFYFPVLTADDEFPDRVHLAWEEALADGTAELHRLTWSLGPIRPAVDPESRFDVYPTYLYDEATGAPVPQDGDQVDAAGRLVRTYAWDTKPSPVTCHFTHAIFPLKDLRGDLFDLDPSRARYPSDPDGVPQRDVDLRLDFIPVVHEPNDAAGRRHFGRSILLWIAQVLDDLAGAETDLQESSALVGSATLVTTGGPHGDLEAGPGRRLELEPGQGAQYLDTSRNLDALLKYADRLDRVLSTNSRISQALMGKIDASEVPSGFALALSFSPTQSLVREMRAVRDEKLPLLLKFALRMAQAAGQLPKGPTPDARLVLGSFLPADKAQAVEQVTKALAEGAMSTQTAVQVLMEAGFPIDDAQAEVQRIQHESFEKAVQLLDALGDEEAVAEFLGRALPTAGEADDDGDGQA